MKQVTQIRLMILKRLLKNRTVKISKDGSWTSMGFKWINVQHSSHGQILYAFELRTLFNYGQVKLP